MVSLKYEKNLTFIIKGATLIFLLAPFINRDWHSINAGERSARMGWRTLAGLQAGQELLSPTAAIIVSVAALLVVVLAIMAMFGFKMPK